MKLVSAIMPTRARPDWAAKALQLFLGQTYQNRELVIIDDAEEPSFAKRVTMPGVHYFTCSSRMIWNKRNEACALAQGEIIAHLDSDDWSDPERIASQVRLMEESGKAVAGFHSMFFYDERTKRAYKFIREASYAIGTSLTYTREFWKAHPFRAGRDHPNIGEDNHFVETARNCGQLTTADGGSLMVARIHDGSTNTHNLSAYEYRPVAVDTLPKGFFA